MVSEVSC